MATAMAAARPKSGYALALLTGVYALGYADRGIINLLLEPIKAEFTLSDTQLALMTGLGFTTFQVALSIPIARWADRANRVAILAAGLLVWSVMTGLGALAASALMLAVARMGVGVGEAALAGPSHSILSDYYPRDRRPGAFSIMGAGGEIGVILALLVGGWVSHTYGWRAAFLVAGLPGIALAAVLYFTLPEPVRGTSDEVSVIHAPEPLRTTLARLLTQPSFLCAVLASMAMGLNIFGAQVWVPSFLHRVYHLDTRAIGTLTAALRVVMSVSGALLGGYVSGKCVARWGVAWFLRFPAVICVVSSVALLGFLFAPTLPLSAACLGIVNFTIGAQLGPIFSAVQTITPARSRAFAAAVFVSTTQLFGLGIGTLLVGLLSDALKGAHGDVAIRYALLIPVGGALLGGIIYWIGSYFVAADVARAGEPVPSP